MLNQKGVINLYLIVVIFIISLMAAYYLGTKTQQPNKPSIGKAEQILTSPTLKPSSVPMPQFSVNPSPNNRVSGAAPIDMSTYFINLFPKDMPVYPGAKMADYNDGGAGNQGPCMEELLKQDPKCLQVNFKFIKDLKDASVEKIVNWYVSNPVPGWIYRGVYGDQRDYQFGDIYNKSVYYRMEYRYPNPEHSVIEIYYNGPYPISNLSPKP